MNKQIIWLQIPSSFYEALVYSWNRFSNEKNYQSQLSLVAGIHPEILSRKSVEQIS